MLHSLLAGAPARLRPLPERVEDVLERLSAPPRLIAHLMLVHDGAWQLCDGVEAAWPEVRFDREAVLVGAATHDIGKLVYPEELRQAGTRHEEVGEGILLDHGFPPHQARFARTHGGPVREASMTLEDWMVMLADSTWKGARRPFVEEGLLAALVQKAAIEPWQAYTVLADLAEQISLGADERLAWHAAQSTEIISS